MTDSIEYTFFIELTSLDDEYASFSSQKHAAQFDMPLSNWINMGRPGHIAVAISKSESVEPLQPSVYKL